MRNLLPIAIILFMTFGCVLSDNAPPVARSIPQIFARTIVNDTIPVGARASAYYRFEVSGSARVKGHFNATGGSNDIEVLIVDQDGFANFSNGHNASTYYYSGGYVTAGTIDLSLSGGTYYLIFNNSKSLLTNKVVKTEVTLE